MRSYPSPTNPCKDKEQFRLGNDIAYFIFYPAETVLIGSSSMSTRLGPAAGEIGYWIHKDDVNQGYAPEAAAGLTKVTFEVGHITRVEIHCDLQIVRSASVPRKLGYILESTLHNRVEDIDGDLGDAMIWSLFEASYPSSPLAKMEIQAYDAMGRRIL
jgi:RimJ/RimL family protein N-acetyltransferase